MRRNNRAMVNDIEHCLAQAHQLTNPHIRHPLCTAFRCLAGDETTGLVAYAIWRGRSQVISVLNRVPGYMQSGASKSRASQAQSCWHEEGVAFDDLPHQRRSWQ